MKIAWECIKTLFAWVKGGRKEYRDEFTTAFNALRDLTELLQKQVDMQDDKIEAQYQRLEEFEKLRFLARKFKQELQKCEEAYAKCREKIS